MFLTDDELFELTGYRQARKQGYPEKLVGFRF